MARQVMNRPLIPLPRALCGLIVPAGRPVGYLIPPHDAAIEFAVGDAVELTACEAKVVQIDERFGGVWDKSNDEVDEFGWQWWDGHDVWMVSRPPVISS